MSSANLRLLILTPFNYKALYDKVWQQRLIQVMMDTRVPTFFIRLDLWILSACQMNTAVRNTRCQIFVMHEGLHREVC